jgi:Calcineurin-like phosphoesterase
MDRRLLLLPIVVLLYAPLPLAAQFKFPLKSGSVRFAVIGDMGTGKKGQYETAQEMVQMRRSFPFHFVITLGDNIYGGNSPRDFEKTFALPYKMLLDAGVKFYASLGNHDGPAERAYKFFNMNGANYYAFSKGNVRFLALDSNYMDPKQLDWIRSQLQDVPKSDWKICYFHHPLFSSARKHGPATDLRLLLQPLFIQYSVNVVFSGHEHVYERVRPQNGIYYFIEGASGQLRYGNLRPDSNIMAKGFDTDNSFMLVEVAGDTMYFETVSRTGETVDSGTIPRAGKLTSWLDNGVRAPEPSHVAGKVLTREYRGATGDGR